MNEPAPSPDRPPSSNRRALAKLAAGPAAAAAVAASIALASPDAAPGVGRMAAVAVWMAVWWVTEAIPIPVTSLLPLVLLPLLGIQPIKEVAPNYSASVIYLFLGGFMLALGLQASGAHKRLALWIIHRVGDRPRQVVLGFMLASAFLSMWISNTATVMVLMPIVLSVLQAVRERSEDLAAVQPLGVAAMLGIAYAADIGGMATLVGTPPNLSYSRVLTTLFPDAPPPAFAEWLLLGLPLSTVFLALGWVLLTRVPSRLPNDRLIGGREVIAEMRKALGPIRRDEVMTCGVFGATALLWLTRGGASVPGWSHLPLFEAGYVDDAFVAVLMAILLFVLPSADRPGERLMEWRMTQELPWGMLLLFGGGFALAAGFKASGLSAWVGGGLAALRGVSPLVVVSLVCVVLTGLTELTSNTATTEMVLPILAEAGKALGTDPRALMIPATLSASCAFMMPVASPTQAIVFGSGWVPIKAMVRAGLWFNALGVLLVVVVFWALCGVTMGIDPAVVPDWAH
ncbi:MAG: SLC13/DASS family transporter [Planctomycetes bacterium]|nr:SLC13/DASS family transporter [Planctomycetota bacterium]